MKSYEVAPSPEQLFTIAEIAVSAATELEVLKPSSKTHNAVIFIPREIEVMDVDGDDVIEKRFRFFGKVGCDGYGQWAMSMIEDYYVLGDWNNAKTRLYYSFAWDAKGVDTALVKERCNMYETENVLDIYGASGMPTALSESPISKAVLTLAPKKLAECVFIDRAATPVSLEECELLLYGVEAFFESAKELRAANQL